MHVDDTALGGHGPLFSAAVDRLRARFPYRKWRMNSGEFAEHGVAKFHKGRF